MSQISQRTYPHPQKARLPGRQQQSCCVFILYKHIFGKASIKPMLGLVFVHLCDALSLNIEFLHFLPLSPLLPNHIWDIVI